MPKINNVNRVIKFHGKAEKKKTKKYKVVVFLNVSFSNCLFVIFHKYNKSIVQHTYL